MRKEKTVIENRLHQIEERLSDLPPGKLLIETHTSEHDTPFLFEEPASCTDGKGLVEKWAVFPGIVLTHSIYRANHFGFRHAPLESVMQINHCRFGRIGWEMRDGIHIYLGPGDLSLHMMDGCAESSISLPLGYYEGMAILVDLKQLERNPPEILREADICSRPFYHRLRTTERYTAMPANPQIDHIFSELYALPPSLQLPYFKLKVQELLLFLTMLEPKKEKVLDQYRSQQIQIIQAIHRQLTGHLDHRFTIEELSKQYLINTSSLKEIFKSVYGAPVAAYMKEYRIRKAAQLLRETKYTIAEIAEQVGYENQSKFSAAFKEIMQTLPTAYRRQYQNVTQDTFSRQYE